MVTTIAITGNIASGKSQAEKIIESLGYSVYDSDKIAHEILDKFEDFYGYDVFVDGKIDRKKLGSLVFANPDIKKQLEQLIHPKIKSKIVELFEKHKSEKYIFISVPLLFEAGFEDLFDKIIFISADKNIRLKRLMQRNNYPEEEALLRINSQLPENEKIKKSSFIVENNSTIEELNKQIKDVLGKI